MGSFLTFWTLMGYFWVKCGVKNTVLGSKHVVEQLSFSMFPWILTFEFDLILGSFLSFWGPNRLVSRSEESSTIVFGSTHVIVHLLFSMIPWILTFEFDWFFCLLGALMGWFGGWSGVWQLFWGLLMLRKNFPFLRFLQFRHLILT